MRKKTKLFGSIAAICASICMMVIGVLAASQVNLNVTSSVSFDSNGAYVKVKGEVQKGNSDTEPTRATEPLGSDYYYIGYSYDAVDEEQETDTKVSDYNDIPVGTPSVSPMTAWTIGNVEFSETESIIRYSLTFTNYSEKPVQATITTNKDTFLSDSDIQGKVSISETSNSVIIDGYDGVTPQTATYSITLTLTNFSSSFTNISLTIDVNFSTEIVEQEVEELVPGLEASVIPGTNTAEIVAYDFLQNAQNIVIPESFSYAEKEFSSILILEWENMEHLENSRSIIILLLGDLNIVFANGTKRELINYYEFMSEMQSGIIGEDAFPLTIEQTFNLRIENTETDITILGEYADFLYRFNNVASSVYIFELPKVKENGSTELVEFQTMEEFTAYASSVSSMAAEKFPLEFQLPTPKYMVMVEGYDYTVTSIGDCVFEKYSSLASIEIPSSVTSIGDFAFGNCSSLANVTFEENSQLTSIGRDAFNGCSILTSVSLPSKLTSIGQFAFSGCSGLTGELKIPEGVTSIGYYAFSGCSGLTGKLVIPEGVTSIVDYAFYNCSGLTSLSLPNSLTSIGTYAFGGCSSLTGELVIPGKVTSIGIDAFVGCSGLSSVSLPNKLTSIGNFAFYGCSGLTSVSLPSKLTSIGPSAFNECTSLKYIQITGNLTSSYSLPSGTWVKTGSATEPTDWTTNVVDSILASDSIGYYHQQSAWESAT